MRNGRVLVLILPFLFGCVSPKNADTFTKAGLLGGSVMTQADCNDPDTSLWITVSGKGECVRYFHSGLEDENEIVHVWLHGDRIRRVRGVNFPGNYSNQSAKKQETRADRIYQRTAIPTILLSRPGTFGSSGFHSERRRPRNVNIVLQAVSALKERFAIKSFAISGQSGGGHLIGAILANRNDIQCAVSTAGVLAVRERNRVRNWPTDITGYSDFYDPIDHVNKIPKNESRAIFVVADPRDTNVPFITQTKYVQKVREHDHKIFLVRAAGRGNEYHSLSHVGFAVVRLCVDGLSSADIVERTSTFR